MDRQTKQRMLALPGVSGVDETENGEVILYTDGEKYERVEGITVSCMKVGSMKLLSMLNSKQLSSKDSTFHREKWRPVVAGISGSSIGNTAGTIGCKVTKNGEPMLLSNTHIFGTRKGIKIIQPSPYDGGTEADIIGENAGYTDVDMEEINEVDAALAVCQYPIAENILDLGVIRGVEEPRFLMGVQKSGRTSGVTSGRIVGTNGMFKVDYSKQGVATFDGLIVTNNMGDPGDSGSLLMNNNKAVGLLFAGSDQLTLYIPMHKIVRQLGIEIGN